MLPGSEEEETAFSTGIELLAARLGEGGEAILHKDDEGQMGIEGSAHDGLLAWRDGGRDDNGSLASCCHVASHLFLNLGLGAAARHANLQAARPDKQLEVAEGSKGIALPRDVEVWAQELRVGTLQEQATRVVGEVVLPHL